MEGGRGPAGLRSNLWAILDSNQGTSSLSEMRSNQLSCRPRGTEDSNGVGPGCREVRRHRAGTSGASTYLRRILAISAAWARSSSSISTTSPFPFGLIFTGRSGLVSSRSVASATKASLLLGPNRPCLRPPFFGAAARARAPASGRRDRPAFLPGLFGQLAAIGVVGNLEDRASMAFGKFAPLRASRARRRAGRAAGSGWRSGGGCGQPACRVPPC